MIGLAIPGITGEVIESILVILDSEKDGKLKISNYTDAVYLLHHII